MENNRIKWRIAQKDAEILRARSGGFGVVNTAIVNTVPVYAASTIPLAQPGTITRTHTETTTSTTQGGVPAFGNAGFRPAGQQIGQTSTFGLPQQSFGQPQQSFGLPQQTFGQPQQTFGQPQKPFGATSYGSPIGQPQIGGLQGQTFAR